MEENLKLVAAVVGVLGFVLACFNLYIALSNRRQARSIAFAQKKTELFGLLLEGEVIHMEQRIVLTKIRNEADQDGAMDVAEEAHKLIEKEEAFLVNLRIARPALQALGAKSQSHDALLMLSEQEPTLKEWANADKHAVVSKTFVEPAREYLEFLRAQRKKAGVKKIPNFREFMRTGNRGPIRLM